MDYVQEYRRADILHKYIQEGKLVKVLVNSRAIGTWEFADKKQARMFIDQCVTNEHAKLVVIKLADDMGRRRVFNKRRYR